jgi:hypothetical protein
MNRLAFLLIAALVVGAAPALAQYAPSSTTAPAAQPAQRTNIRGIITGLSGDVLSIETAKGPVKVSLAPNGQVRTVAKYNLADITTGSYVQAAALPQPDGTLKAIEVTVITSTPRAPEGYGPWDLQPNSTMTNANVTDIGSAKVQGVDNRVLTLTYKGGTKKLIVGPTTPVVTYVLADRSVLTPGTKVVIINATPKPDGTYAATNVTAGKNGVDPPM